jgi:cytochrome c biogenesis protein CcdA/thiol-disulfide isomerase/thioredoxin
VLFLVAFIGGAASVLTPCVLPLLPAILAVSGNGRRRVLGIVIGLELSFFLVGLILAGILSATGLPNTTLQWVSAVLLACFGIVLLVPRLDRVFQDRVSALVTGVPQASNRGSGFGAGVLAGAPLGIVWAPCAGPILAGISIAAASVTFSGRTVLMMVAYALGMLGPLILVVSGGQRATDFFKKRLRGGRTVPAVMGVLLLATAVIVGSGGLNAINRVIAETINLTSTPTAAIEKTVLIREGSLDLGNSKKVELTQEQLANSGYPEIDGIVDYGPAPDLEGISHWFNTEGPLPLSELRGNVVLIDFWTYSCINCIRTFPYLRNWYAQYHDQGFEIIGVHTPEFTFEKDPGNVGAAIEDFDIDYPVALDPDYATWENYHNVYWPAHYLIDKNGHIRSVHYGEGAYTRTENQIRTLLRLPGTSSPEEEPELGARTPETYLGYARADRFAGVTEAGPGLVPEEAAVYEAPTPDELPADWWSYQGEWTVKEDHAVSGANASVVLKYFAANVYMVVGPPDRGPVVVRASGANGATGAITVDRHRLYMLRSGERAEGILRVEVPEGAEVYTFTFG